MFRCRVRGIADLAKQPRCRGNVDQITAASLNHRGNQGSSRIDLCHHVDTPASLPTVIDWMQSTFSRNSSAVAVAIAHAGVRDKHVDAAALDLDLINKSDDRGFVANVECFGNAVDLFRDVVRSFGLNIRDDDFHAVRGEAATERTPDTVATTGYYGDFDLFLRLIQLRDSRRFKVDP